MRIPFRLLIFVSSLVKPYLALKCPKNQSFLYAIHYLTCLLKSLFTVCSLDPSLWYIISLSIVISDENNRILYASIYLHIAIIMVILTVIDWCNAKYGPDYLYSNRTDSHYNDVIISAMASQFTGPTIFTQPFIQAQTNETIEALRHWPLWGEFTAQRASYAEHVSIWWRHHWLQTVFTEDVLVYDYNM